MGTELVPFKTWEEYSVWHSNMKRRSQKFHDNFVRIGLIGAGAIAVALIVLFNLSSILLFIALLSVGAGFVWERVGGSKVTRRNQICNLPSVALEFPCPHCFKNFNLGNAWVCGWCKEPHDDWLPGSPTLRTPVQGCSNNECEKTQTQPFSNGVGDQAALQCPNCHRHIVLDPVLYEQRQCHMHPYAGVARTYGDTFDPVSPRPIVSVYPSPPGSPEKPKAKDSGRRDRLDDI